MELILPDTMTVTIGAIAAFLTLFASIIGVYFRLAASLSALEEQIEKMEKRNSIADSETEAVKAEQAAQKTTVAVMAEQISNQSKLMERIDRNIDEMMKRVAK